MNAFFHDVFTAFVKHVDLDSVKCVVIASGGSTKDEFRGFMLTEAKRLKMKGLEEKKSRIVVVGTKGKGELEEVLNESRVMNVLKESGVGMEMRAFRELWEILESDSGRACYGEKSVEAAQEMKAIETLLITDELYRNGEIGTRKKY